MIHDVEDVSNRVLMIDNFIKMEEHEKQTAQLDLKAS